MRVAAILGTVLSFIMGLLAILYISDLQDQGEGLTKVGSFFAQFTNISVILVVGLLGIGTLIAGAVFLARRRA